MPIARKKRPRADWVYRPNGRALGLASFSDNLGTYEGVIHTIGTGVSNAASKILYDSHNYFAEVTRGGVGTALNVGTVQNLGRQARAEGQKATMLAVEGIVYMEATAWALGNLIAAGFRLGIFDQDPSGVFSVEQGYSMWTNELVQPFSPISVHANDGRNNTREWRKHHFFTSTTPSAMVVPIRWRGRRTLQPGECFGLYVELESTSVAARCQFFLRTLVIDEG